MYPAQDTLQRVIKAWLKVEWQKAEKTLPVFFFVNETQTRSLKLKETIFKVMPEEKQQLVEQKDADNVRKYFVNHWLSGFEN